MSGRRAGVAAILAVLAALSGCPQPETYDEQPSPPTTLAAGSVNAIEHPGRVPALIREHLGEDPEIRRLNLDSTGFSLEVRDEVKRENIDSYDFYRGEWNTRPVSVSLSEISEFESRTFHLGDINWAAVPGLIRQALDGLDLEGEEVGVVAYDRLVGDPPRVYISVTGLRGNGRLVANADGTEVDVQRN